VFDIQTFTTALVSVPKPARFRPDWQSPAFFLAFMLLKKLLVREDRKRNCLLTKQRSWLAGSGQYCSDSEPCTCL